VQRVALALGFGSFGIGTPMLTFAEPLHTLPPGLVFDFGAVHVGDEVFPIRFLHIEARRVVIDVAAETWVIDHVYQRLRDELSGVRAADGGPGLGEHQNTLEYSEIVARYRFSPTGWINPQLAEAVNQPGSDGLILVPTVYLAPQAVGDESAGSVVQANSRMFQFSLRTGTRAAEHIYFSGAPLTSDAHRAFLERFETAFAC